MQHAKTNTDMQIVTYVRNENVSDLLNLLKGHSLTTFNFSMKKASRAYNFCIISKRHVVFRWQSVGQIKTRLNAQKYKKRWKQVCFLAL